MIYNPLFIFLLTAISIEGEDGATPLHYAARFRAVKLKLSLSRGASTDTGLVAAPLENAPGNTEPTGLSLQPGVDLLDCQDEGLINFLVGSGADVNSQDKYGWTPLHFAASKCNIVATNELLAYSNIRVDVSII